MNNIHRKRVERYYWFTALAAATLAGLFSDGVVRGQVITPPPGPIIITKPIIITPLPATPMISITQPGSYVLGRNVVAPPGYAGNGIVIDADDVTLDLNGFAVLGVPGSLDGIVVVNPHQNISIFNGTIADWGQDGVDLSNAENSQLDRLRVSGNGEKGIRTGDQCVVTNCLSASNGGDGLSLGNGNVVADCTTNDNGEDGFDVGENSTVRHCTSKGNLFMGIITPGSCTIQDCTALSNGSHGILVGFGGTITGSTARSNTGVGILADFIATITDCTSTQNTLDGFFVGELGTLTQCTAGNNQQNGIRAGQYSTVSACSAGDNLAGGIVTDGGCTVNGCTASGNGTLGISADIGSNVEYCTASRNVTANIRVTSYCRVVGNTCEALGVGSWGIHLTQANNRVEGNTIHGCLKGLKIDGGQCEVAANVVAANADNYDFALGNRLDLLLAQIPESIDWPANVTLAGSLTGTNGANGITIASDNVTIDLGGHALLGVAGSLDGIAVSGARNRIVVRNGRAASWGGDGVDLFNATTGSLEGVMATNNGGDGLRLGSVGRVSGCEVRSNGGDGLEVFDTVVITETAAHSNTGRGIVANSGATITHCNTASNTGNGVEVSTNSTVMGCTSNSNSGAGFMGASDGSSFIDCTAMGNTSVGIFTNAGGVVQGCAVKTNGDDGIRGGVSVTISNCSAYANTGDGIEVNADCTVIGNTCGQSGLGAGTGAGIHVVVGDNRIEGNNVTRNDFGIDVDGAGNLVIRNSASGNTSGNYSIAAGNSVGPTVTAATIGANNSPHANYDY